MKYLWKDCWPWWSYFVKIILLSPTIPILITMNKWELFLSTDTINILSFIIFISVSFFGFSVLITHKLSYITQEGILLGTVSRDDHIENPKLSLRKFLPWSEIRQINIYKKKCKRSFGITDFVSTLQITTRNGKKYECYINDISGFYNSLKSVGKSSFVAKRSYSGSSTTDVPVKKFSYQKTQYAGIIYRVILGILLIILLKIVFSKLFG